MKRERNRALCQHDLSKPQCIRLYTPDRVAISQRVAGCLGVFLYKYSSGQASGQTCRSLREHSRSQWQGKHCGLCLQVRQGLTHLFHHCKSEKRVSWKPQKRRVNRGEESWAEEATAACIAKSALLIKNSQSWATVMALWESHINPCPQKSRWGENRKGPSSNEKVLE